MPLLEISQLKKSFVSPEGPAKRIIDVKHFSLASKAHVALQGESGSGKTTFLHLIAGILKPDSGSLLLAGQEMCQLAEPQRDRLRATTIGYIFQNFNLLEGYTCLENVLLAMSFGRGSPETGGIRRTTSTLPQATFYRSTTAGGGRPGLG